MSKETKSSALELKAVEYAKNGELKLLKKLYENNAKGEKLSPDARDADGETGLMWAAGRGWLDVVKFLVAKGANLELVDHWGFNALMLAAQCGKLEVCMFLVNSGASFTARSTGAKGGRTARQLAAAKREMRVVNYLLMKERESGIFSGMFSPVMTEFDEKTHRLLVKNIPAYAKHLVKTGVRGVFACGTCGESMTLSEEERKTVIEAWVQARNTLNLPLVIIAQVGCESVEAAAALAAHAQAVGADAVSCMVPTFFKPPSVREAVAFTAKVAAAAPGSHFLFYQFPGMTGGNMKASEWTQAARVVMPNLAGLKFTSLDVVDYAMLCQNDPNNHLAFLPGYESAYSAFAALNSSTGRRFGGVGGCSNFMNSLMARFIKIAESDEMTSKTKFKQLEAITTLVRRVDAIAKKTSFTAVLKVAMQRLGIATSIAVRLPARELSAEEAKWVKGELDALYVDVERLLGGEA